MKLIKKWVKSISPSVPYLVLALVIVTSLVTVAAIKPTANKHGSLKGTDFGAVEALDSTSATISDGITIDIGGTPHLTFYVTVSAAANVTVQIQPCGQTTWFDGNVITATGIYSDGPFYGGCKLRFGVDSNTGTVTSYVGASPVTGKPGVPSD